jgi:hypothetical protein
MGVVTEKGIKLIYFLLILDGFDIFKTIKEHLNALLQNHLHRITKQALNIAKTGYCRLL